MVWNGEMAEIRAKMSCVFRLEKWLLIDIRGMADGFWVFWKVFFIKGSGEWRKVKVIYRNRGDFN